MLWAVLGENTTDGFEYAGAKAFLCTLTFNRESTWRNIGVETTSES
jgi:hypothetical protein